MDKYFIKSIVIVAFILLGVNATFANDNWFVQSFNMDNNLVDETDSSINMKQEIIPAYVPPNVVEEENTNILTPEEMYPYQNPYGYNTNHVQYRIGPYYTTGINRGFGFNYKGFGYNYKGHGYNYGYSTSNKHPIYIAPPPPPPPMHKPHGM